MNLRYITLLLPAFFLLGGCSRPPPPAEGFTAAKGLEFTLWAQEPDVVNPTNIDIDHRGRIWVLEAINYRRHLKDQPDYDPKGDRIVILEDTDGDGRADSRKVFDQNPELRSPLGISVLGDKVLVSQSPDLIVYTKDEDDNIVDKQVLLSGWKGYDHDHGLHAVLFGHDGRYYFNSGDQGFDVTDRSGKKFVSSRQGPYYAGTALRVDPDGTNFTVLGHNFRNPYELALDSFGSILQTDNDDDGNRWTRLNYVMEGGNFGYWGPGGRSWREDRGSHFHSELPGVVPNIARTGPGSPTGLVVYEGALLPPKYRGQLLHSEAGKRLVNAFFIAPDGAGYKAEIEKTVQSDDSQFRPSDVAVAPDGAVFVSDWYDAVVGGHDMKDIEKGRIYRLTPPGYEPVLPQIDLDSDQGLMEALRSPAQSVRYLAYTTIKEKGHDAVELLQSMWKQADPILRARTLWLLGGVGDEGGQAVREALADPDPNFRVLGIRVARLHEYDVLELLRNLLGDSSAQVRREIALALRHIPDDSSLAGREKTWGQSGRAATSLPVTESKGRRLGQSPVFSQALDHWIELAKSYDGQDRWYLEALAIGARGKESALYPRLLKAFRDKWNSKLADLLWVLRPPEALPYVTRTFRDRSLSLVQRKEALRVLGAMRANQAALLTARAVTSGDEDPAIVEQAFASLSRQLFSEWIEFRSEPAVVAAVRQGLRSPNLQAEALSVVDGLGDPVYGPQLFALADSATAPDELRVAALEALGSTRQSDYAPVLDRLSKDGPTAVRVAALRGLGVLRPDDLESRLETLILSDAPNEVSSEAARILGRTSSGLHKLLDMEEQQKLPAELLTLATFLANAGQDEDVVARAEKLLPPPAGKNKETLARPRALAVRIGDPEKGKKVFFDKQGADCASCHSLTPGEHGTGPNLSAIGDKLGEDALVDSILNPSAGIAPEYYSWILGTVNQGVLIGILDEDTPERVVLRTETGDEIRLKPEEITSRRRSNLSMMPEDLVNKMTEQELIDLVEFLATLRGGEVGAARRGT